MKKEDLTQLEGALTDLQRKSMALNGVVFVSGATTINGNFYGFAVGSTKPDTLKITCVKGKGFLNNAELAATDDIINFVSEGEFVPVEFTSMTTTGATGCVKCYSK